ncbi:MAG: NAD-dependent succinate-semialdehyde dehydrogenase [Desulfobacterales bacterium]
MKVINPATGEKIDEFAETSESEVQEKIDSAAQAWEQWRGSDIAQRAACLRETAQVLKAEKESLAARMALEMGKPIRDGEAEIDKCAWLSRHYAEEGAQMLAPETVATDAAKSYVAFAPLGVILAVMPWNYPFWQVLRFAAPALMAGNGILLKHAANVPGCSLAIEALMKKAGFPKQLFQSLLIPGERVPEVLDDPRVRAVSLTGSTSAGQAVAARAGSLLKKSLLELGGSDPYLILADADLELTVEACAASRLLNSGQSCIAAKRFIVEKPVAKAFVEGLRAKMAAVRMGDPLDKESAIGPQARKDLRLKLHQQVRDSMDKGARCLLGGEIPQGRGFFYPPTVLVDVEPGMPVFEEETFGPVCVVTEAADEREAIRLANTTPYGLGAAVFTGDTARGERIAAEELQAGNCFVNAFVRSDPRLPFGGIKQSGYGRELSHYGLREFVNIKTVYVVQP